jgi:hypothetical protein
MTEWAKVDGYVALKMMQASVELAQLNKGFERLQLDIALGQATSFQTSAVRRHCNKLSGYLSTALYQLDEVENAAKAADKLKIVK